MTGKKVDLTPEQRRAMEKLWFVYGNRGPKTTRIRHRFIQCFLEEGVDEREFFKPDKEVLAKVDEILNKNQVTISKE